VYPLIFYFLILFDEIKIDSPWERIFRLDLSLTFILLFILFFLHVTQLGWRFYAVAYPPTHGPQ